MRKSNKLFALGAIVIVILAAAIYANLSRIGGISGEGQRREERLPNILFILVDALRPDHLGCYGYARDTSPNIDKIAAGGIVFTDFYTVCPWTKPTVACLFTGLYPQEIFPPLKLKKAIQKALPKEFNTLAEILTEKGYYTFALMQHCGLTEQANFSQGFKEFVNIYEEGDVIYDISDVLKIFSERLGKIRQNNFFIYLHLIYSHQPYDSPAPYNQMFGPVYKTLGEEEREGVINAYDSAIRYADELIGNIVAGLKEKNLLDNTYVIITSDHGEGFWDHGSEFSEHGNSLYNELLRVPLIIYPPGGRTDQPARIDNLAGNIDIFPTLLDIAKAKRPAQASGRSLFRFFDKQYKNEGGVVISESAHSNLIHAYACQNKKLKYIFDFEREEGVVYDLKEDPEEKRPLADKNNNSRGFKKLLQRHKSFVEERRNSRTDQAPDISLDEDALERFRSLGYVQ